MTEELTTSEDDVKKPWGSFRILDNGDGFAVKRISVLPGESLSLQKHKYRSEHWIVVAGRARIVCGEKVFDLSVDQHIYIPRQEKHRLENIGNECLEVIEVQSGSYLAEDDIVRLEDRYGR